MIGKRKRPLDREPTGEDELGILIKTMRLLEEQNAALLAREQVREQRLSWLQAVIDHVPAYIYAKDREGRFVVCNRQTLGLHDLADEGQMLGKTDFDLHRFNIAEDFFSTEQEVVRSGRAFLDREEEVVFKDGRCRCVLTSKVPVAGPDGAGGIVGFSYDISSRKEAEKLTLGQASMFGMVARSMPLNDIVSSIVQLVQSQVPGALGSVQLLSEDGGHLGATIAPSVPDDYKQALDGLAIGPAAGSAGAAAWSGESVVIADLAADPLWRDHAAHALTCGIHASWSTPIMSYQDRVLGAFSVYQTRVGAPTSFQSDLIAMASHMVGMAVERRQVEDRIHFLAHHDPLTGLLNRSMFEERLTAALETARAEGGSVTLAFFDLDHFKLINDSLGHDAGDQLLKIIAGRAKGCLGSDDIIARLGGDEFVALVTDTSTTGDRAYLRLATVQAAVAMPIALCGRSLRVTLSLGIARFPDHGETATTLLANADLAMYHAKASGRDTIQVFSLEMAAEANAKLFRDQELRDALAGNQLRLHFQPQVDLQTGRVFALEALVRWDHPDRGLIPPGDFIPLAEENGLIVPIGDWVLRTACAQNRAWQDAGLPPVVVSVNVSRRQFIENEWASRVAAVLAETGLAAQHLELEITESLIMHDLARAKATLMQLDALGVRLAIDDFGTGYSSLSALKSFPVDLLKIDRSFVKDIPEDQDDMAITAAIISLAQQLDLRVLAEGVETQAQVDFLLQCGCREAQGYLFGRPACADEISKLLGHTENE